TEATEKILMFWLGVLGVLGGELKLRQYAPLFILRREQTVDERERQGGDADHGARGDGPPQRIGAGELPDGEDGRHHRNDDANRRRPEGKSQDDPGVQKSLQWRLFRRFRGVHGALSVAAVLLPGPPGLALRPVADAAAISARAPDSPRLPEQISPTQSRGPDASYGVAAPCGSRGGAPRRCIAPHRCDR